VNIPTVQQPVDHIQRLKLGVTSMDIIKSTQIAYRSGASLGEGFAQRVRVHYRWGA
jgi:hypothetical protein